MAQKSFIEISSNLPELTKAFKRLGGTNADIKDIARAAAIEAVYDAVKAAPVDEGTLRKSIGIKPRPDLGEAVYALFAAVFYAPYQEFGTGTNVEVPQELTDFALQFKGQRNIEGGITPQPFLYPAALKAQEKIRENIRQFITEQLKL